ncbi:MAG: hypothetical protein RXR51_07985 [Nitrososphaeria archaeon]
MENKELPDKIIGLFKELNRAERSFDEWFPDDDLFPYDEPWWVYRRTFRDVFNDIYKRSEVEINVIPRILGGPGKCTDTLLIFIQPSFLTLQGDEYHPEMRLKKRIESAIDFCSKCKNVKYIIFWASIWEFRIWEKYKNRFANQTVILKPWKLPHIILK